MGIFEAVAFIAFVAGVLYTILWSVRDDPEATVGKKKFTLPGQKEQTEK